ncbi:DUF1684 domain-containing protein [Hugenholtzia roseola]|uniref:DUF1684 domain-containing protein n=1 Tax=Hugenholtzia roseola TaxID=1002 RepID=UPI0012B5AC1A|nr:DUF1684 domain-containing protein [Hugenholtzia roseola]
MKTKNPYLMACYALPLWLLLMAASCVPKTELELNKHRQEQDSFMKGSGSPLKSEDKKNFQGLAYFAPDSSYRVEANLTLAPADEQVIELPTSTGKKRKLLTYAYADFTLKGQKCRLTLYKGVEEKTKEDYLFLPFTDPTNGKTTYEVGRYLEPVLKGTKVVIDFNFAYNPYCAYNDTYDCPIPPQENHLPIEILAGEKKFK